jgi:hypothetical protein
VKIEFYFQCYFVAGPHKNIHFPNQTGGGHLEGTEASSTRTSLRLSAWCVAVTENRFLHRK